MFTGGHSWVFRKDIKEKMDAGYSPFHIRLFQTKSNLFKRGFPSASPNKGLEISHPAKGIIE